MELDMIYWLWLAVGGLETEKHGGDELRLPGNLTERCQEIETLP